jgi:hypothetical protein
VAFSCGFQIYSRLNQIDVELGQIKQRIADGGTHEIVSKIDAIKTPEEARATMTLVRGQVELEAAEGKAPNEAKIRALTPSLVETAREAL